MKKISQAIMNFAADNNLRYNPEGICFDARVLVFTKRLSMQTKSEIHIVTIGGYTIDNIYLLNPAPGIEQFPTHFESGFVDISYQPKKGLFIKGFAASHGLYKMLLQPLTAGCTDQILAELKAKTCN